MKSPDKKIKRSKPRTAARHQLGAALDFFAEAGLLKKVKRSGWWVAGIKDPESVADHCFRCAVIAYYLAHLEKVDPYKTLTMALFNDIHESRINDLHKMGHYYIDFKVAEKKVFKDQIKRLDVAVQSELSAFRREYDQQTSRESRLARDADILECLIQAKEYLQNGHSKAREFLNRAPAHLKSKSAQGMWNELKGWDSASWWQSLVKFER